ncbi:MAG: hypothetical protein GY887_16645 [Halieaceae bacterium]|nr:hypothetical protein [Halieaceae bacterium]
MDLEVLTAIFGWCAVINIALLLFSSLWVTVFREFTKRLHSTLMQVDASELNAYYFQYLGNYKLLILVFNIVPYIALRLIA